MTGPSKSSCDRTERVAEYALRALPAEEASGFATHVAECAECREELDALRAIVDAFVDWPTDILRPPRPLWERLAGRIGAAAGDEPEERWDDEPAWQQVAPGISCKVLSTDTTTELVSMLVRLAPGAPYPAHSHASVEELHLLDGELWIDDRKLHPGDYNRAEPGTGDSRVWSETGCTCLLITSLADVLG
jgi:anti-sigma factor ChrR (cupin superfamily)